VSWGANDQVSDISDVDFRIAQPFLKLAGPNTAAVNWGIGTTQVVAWNTNMDASPPVRILLSTDGGATFPITLVDSTSNDKSERVKVPNSSNSRARVKIVWAQDPTVFDTSDANFKIAAPFVTVTQPNGGEKWKTGTSQWVRWDSNIGVREGVFIDLSTNGGASWQGLGLDYSQDLTHGSALVGLPNVTSDKCRIRVRWRGNTAVNDISDANFSIIP
jgi:hypothetical protein